MNINRYTSCFLCNEIVYSFRQYSNKSSDFFFNKHRSVCKSSVYFCLKCYRDLYVKKVVKLKNFTIPNRLFSK
ncbi:ac43-like protein [Cryptophlebia peltastica nucleopolyhedrovirus]|uniref:Ac43-like protein n=1 Tax=Cryptophlebia peltastica nucleopolyhedrovirus TaxID=2304025 RepID=A0A346RNQ2_9ABAC|nr:ac43-like protein [Cryptophlebia peltastica nucleopolyhedrovirus]AXS67699.1 ac43-like protein [Cryptophlebia peltastica nucleopolyhedrovirus]